MKKTIFVIYIFLSIVLNAQSWKLVWSDEFDGNSINTANWTFDIGGSGWGNNELEYYTSRADNAKVENGNLVITAKQESYGGKSYTSARMKTQGLQSFNFGKIEARIKLPLGKGIWPAFWMLGNNNPFVGWPACGEIDIMEHINNEFKVYGTMHWDNNGHASYGGSTTCNVSDYTIYSIEWDKNSIKWFMDGNKFWEGNITNGINSTNEFQLPFFIILNLAVGGNWPGNPDASTTFPATMYVDYVRAYQLVTGIENGGSNGTPTQFRLDQNYPNPFNPSTTINYSIPQTSNVVIKVYNLIGNEVAKLVSENKPIGNYSVKFDGTNLASGVYLCRLQAGNFTQTKKILLMK